MCVDFGIIPKHCNKADGAINFVSSYRHVSTKPQLELWLFLMHQAILQIVNFYRVYEASTDNYLLPVA